MQMMMKERRVDGRCARSCYQEILDGQRTKDGPWQRRESEEESSRAPSSSGIAYSEGAANTVKTLDAKACSVRA